MKRVEGLVSGLLFLVMLGTFDEWYSKSAASLDNPNADAAAIKWMMRQATVWATVFNVAEDQFSATNHNAFDKRASK